MDVGQWVIIILSVLMGAWYVIGATINRRRGVSTYEWIKEGLDHLGKVNEAKWIGSSGSGARLVVGNAETPFRRIEVVFLLDSLEILPLWLFNLIRGKKDEMILKANLRKAPTFEFELARKGNRKLEKLLTNKRLTRLETAVGFDAAVYKNKSEGVMEAVGPFLEKYQASILTISLQRQMPHLIIRVALPALRAGEAGIFFTDIKTWMTLPSKPQS